MCKFQKSHTGTEQHPALVIVRSRASLTRKKETSGIRAKENPQLLSPSLSYLEKQVTKKSHEIMLADLFVNAYSHPRIISYFAKHEVIFSWGQVVFHSKFHSLTSLPRVHRFSHKNSDFQVAPWATAGPVGDRLSCRCPYSDWIVHCSAEFRRAALIGKIGGKKAHWTVGRFFWAIYNLSLRGVGRKEILSGIRICSVRRYWAWFTPVFFSVLDWLMPPLLQVAL